jgi:hypothetical protein
MPELQGEGWYKCTPGVLDRLATTLQLRRRAKRMTNLFAAVVSSTVLTGVLALAGILASRALGYEMFPANNPNIQKPRHNQKMCPPNSAQDAG